ncbi:MAG: hypothetical protein ACPLZF_00105 [Nitrososphaeria archaeon]
MGLSIDVRKFSNSIVFSSLYAIFSFIPVGTGLVGGQGSFSLSLAIPPVAGYLLGPIYGPFSMLIGALAYLFFNPTSFFGFLTPIVPMAGALASGLNRRRLSYIVFLYLLLFSAFLIYYYSEVWWFIIPHTIASISSLLYYIVRGKFRILLNTFSSTFFQHATGTMLAIFLLNINASFLVISFPLMLYERTVSTLVSFLILIALEKYFGQKFFLEQKTLYT